MHKSLNIVKNNPVGDKKRKEGTMKKMLVLEKSG
jgi:hypothetical protein